MFLALGVVPHQWLTHVQNELGWQSDKPFLGPGAIFKSKAKGGNFAFDINYQQIGDILRRRHLRPVPRPRSSGVFVVAGAEAGAPRPHQGTADDLDLTGARW